MGGVSEHDQITGDFEPDAVKISNKNKFKETYSIIFNLGQNKINKFTKSTTLGIFIWSFKANLLQFSDTIRHSPLILTLSNCFRNSLIFQHLKSSASCEVSRMFSFHRQQFSSI